MLSSRKAFCDALTDGQPNSSRPPLPTRRHCGTVPVLRSEPVPRHFVEFSGDLDELDLSFLTMVSNYRSVGEAKAAIDILPLFVSNHGTLRWGSPSDQPMRWSLDFCVQVRL
jgi:hypothetical protein